MSALEPYVDKVGSGTDHVALHPSFGGQKFIENYLEKIRETRAMLNEKGLQTDIQVDGGIYLTNVREVLDAGANIIVAGSAVFRRWKWQEKYKTIHGDFKRL